MVPVTPKNPIFLGVNIDHVATLRQARGTVYPSVVQAALLGEEAGADGITAHLREDRRHIQDRDLFALKEAITTPLNMEMAATEEMLAIAKKLKPHHVCVVPEKREELTTEGGLDVAGNRLLIQKVCEELGAIGIEVSLFIDPDEIQIEAAHHCGAPAIELHTGEYAESHLSNRPNTLHPTYQRLKSAATLAHSAGLIVNAGHGLHYHNTQAIAALPEIVELNIGHAIVARAVMTGLPEAVRTMKQLMVQARTQGF